MTSTYPQLREGVEFAVGMDDHPLLFDAVTRQYHLISDSSVPLIKMMDGQHDIGDLAELVESNYNLRQGDGISHVKAFLNRLSEARLLCGNEEEILEPRRFSFSPLLPRFMIFKGFSKVIAPLADQLKRVPSVPLFGFSLLGSLAGYAIGFSVFFSRQGKRVGVFDPRTVIVATIIMLLGILIHESWHAIVSDLQGQPVRGLGVALLFWISPVAYVDRTDSYRVRSRRGRVLIALAGPMSDGWVCGATGVFTLYASGGAEKVSALLLGFQFILLIANFNPFAHSDGMDALEAATGAVNLRKRSFIMLKSMLLHKPLPKYLSCLSGKTQMIYFIHGVVCSIFAVLFIILTLFNITNSALAQIGRVA